MVDQHYFTVKQAAERLATDEEQVSYWINSGQLVAINVAKVPEGRRRWRIPETDLDQFIQNRRNRKPEPRAKPAPKIREPKQYV